jgi:hypothetical protein
MADIKCNTCGGEMFQKSRVRLFFVGFCMVASIAIAALVPYFWAPGAILVLAGGYLMVWATLGKGLWCRTCKKFNVFCILFQLAGSSIQGTELSTATFPETAGHSIGIHLQVA